MKTVYLHGSLAREFGSVFTMAVDSPAEALRLLNCNFKGFVDAIRDKWFVITTNTAKKGVPEECLAMSTGADEIHIRPVVAGRVKGLFSLFFSFPLISSVFAPLSGAFGLAGAGGAGAAGGFLGFGAVGGATGGFGSILLGLTIIGIGALITGALKPKNAADREDPTERPSFIFDGAVNTIEQGGPVPLVYGRMLTGSVVIAGALVIEELAI